MKKFRIVCNEGSLSGQGGKGRDMELKVNAESEQQAREYFDEAMINRMYGREIKSIEEI